MAGMLTCEPCQKQFTGQVPYNDHLISEKHKKKVESLNFRKTWAESIGIQEPKSSEGPSPRELSQLMCSVCNKSFSGPIPYKMHMDSEVHRKKVAQRNIVGNLKINLPINGNQQAAQSGCILIYADKLSCGVCNMKFETLEKTLEHYESDEHREKKLLVKSLTTVELQERKAVDEVDSSSKYIVEASDPTKVATTDVRNGSPSHNLVEEAPSRKLHSVTQQSTLNDVIIVPEDEDNAVEALFMVQSRSEK